MKPEEIKKLSEKLKNEKMINSEILRLKKEGTLRSKKISDGYHTFEDLYYVRMVMTKIIAESYPEHSVKSKKHFDNENDPMFDGNFIVVIQTPEGDISYHYHLEYWDYFNIKEVEEAPLYDGHKTLDVTRLVSLLDTKIYQLAYSYERDLYIYNFKSFEDTLNFVYTDLLNYIKEVSLEENEIKKFESLDVTKSKESISLFDDELSIEWDKEKQFLEAYSNLRNTNLDYKFCHPEE